MVRGGSRKCNVKYIVPDDTRESNFTKKEWTQKWENTTTVEVQKYTRCVLVREGERFRSWLCTGWFFIIWQSVPPHQSSLLHGKTDYKSRSKLFREQKLVVSSSTFTRNSQNVPWDQRPPPVQSELFSFASNISALSFPVRTFCCSAKTFVINAPFVYCLSATELQTVQKFHHSRFPPQLCNNVLNLDFVQKDPHNNDYLDYVLTVVDALSRFV